MVFRLAAAAVLAASAAFGFGSLPARAADPASPPPPAAAAKGGLPPGNTVVARVNGTELHLSDVETARQSLPPDMQRMPFAKIYPMLLEHMIDGMLVTDAAKKEHLDQSPEFQQRLKLIADRLMQQLYLQQIVKSAQSEDALKASFQKYIKEKPPKEEVHARHILVKSEAEANSVIDQLNKGADFAALAKKYSSDPGAAKGGDLGYFTRDDMVPAFSAAAFGLKPGQYTKTPVKTEFGWHVILVEDKRVKPPPNFEEARPELTQMLARQAVDSSVQQLRREAKVEAFGLDGKPLTTVK